jgi:hypothetical protein
MKPLPTLKTMSLDELQRLLAEMLRWLIKYQVPGSPSGASPRNSRTPPRSGSLNRGLISQSKSALVASRESFALK